MSSVGGGAQRRCLAWIASCAVLASLMGCELPPPPAPELAPVTGVVTFKGVPVASAMVEFIQEGAPFRSAGLTDEDGRFVLTSVNDGDGAPIGSHRVVISVRDVLFDEGAVASTYEVNRRELDLTLGMRAPTVFDESLPTQEVDFPFESVEPPAVVDDSESFGAPVPAVVGQDSKESLSEAPTTDTAHKPVRLPGKYASLESTDLEFEVVGGLVNDFTIVLTD